MSSLYYKHQLSVNYDNWIKSLNSFDNLLIQLENESRRITDEEDKRQFYRRLQILNANYDAQIDLINNLYEFMANNMVDKDKLSYTREKLEIAKRFIISLGGDAQSINWLKREDFYK